MNTVLSGALLACLVAGGPAGDAGPAKRKTQRDPESGAILSVKPKPDASAVGGDLLFRMEVGPHTAGVSGVVIKLVSPDGEKTVEERYVLLMDEAMSDELFKQIMKEIRAAEKLEKIHKLTDGKLKKLRFGMSFAEVSAVLGEPKSRIAGRAQGADFWTYDVHDDEGRRGSLDLRFHFGRLASVLASGPDGLVPIPLDGMPPGKKPEGRASGGRQLVRGERLVSLTKHFELPPAGTL